MSDTSLPAFTTWSSFPFEGNLRVKKLDDPVAIEPPRKGEDANDCATCDSPDEAYIWVNENWRVRAMEKPSGLPMVLILESRSHLDLGDLPNMLAAEMGVMTVRLERAVRSLDGVARVHVNRWGDGAAHLHLWFMARPYGRLQLRGSFLSLWDEVLPPVSEAKWREDLALIAAWLAEFGGEALAQPPRIEWQAPSKFGPESILVTAALDPAVSDDAAGSAVADAGANNGAAGEGSPGAGDEPDAMVVAGPDTSDAAAAATGPGTPDTVASANGPAGVRPAGTGTTGPGSRKGAEGTGPAAKDGARAKDAAGNGAGGKDAAGKAGAGKGANGKESAEQGPPPTAAAAGVAPSTDGAAKG